MDLGGFLILLGLMVVVFSASKRVAVLALMAGALYLSEYQAITFLGLNLFPSRILEIVVLLRVATKGELAAIRLNSIDKTFLALFIFTPVVYTFRSLQLDAFQIGASVDAILIYLPCRALIDSAEDFRWILRSFIWVLVPFVLIIVAESRTSGKASQFMGWRSGAIGYDMRHGRIRCLGSFRHASLLGTIAVSFIPMFVGLAFRETERKIAILGIVLCGLIVWAANSGGPISGTGFGLLAWGCWKVRTKLQYIRRGLCAMFLLAAILMKAPVWYLLAHLSSVTGGDGWHRSYLLEVSTNNIGKWWLAGMPMSETANWFAYKLSQFDHADITNQFILFGITAGLGAVILYVLLFTRAFSAMGNAMQAMRAASSEPSEGEYLLWGMGCMLAAHIVNQIGITYFDQTYVLWFVQLAAVSSVSQWYLNHPPVENVEIEEEMELDKWDSRQSVAS